MSSTSASGVKRPAAGFEDDDGAVGSFLATVPPKQQPRLLEAAAAADPATEVTCTDDIGGNIDLICQIASCMSPGNTLTSFCIAIGPKDAAKVRHGYLLDNDHYIVKMLRKMHVSIVSLPIFDYLDNLPLFEKCKQNMEAWMEINDNWKERCTAENIEQYQDGLIMEADLVFNNPAVAVEIGLLDVVCFMIEKKIVDVNANLWHGFNSAMSRRVGPNFKYYLVELALVRGDASLLQCILSVNGFDLAAMTRDGESEEMATINFSFNDYIKTNCFELFIRHPKVNLNVTDGIDTPLISALYELRGKLWTGSEFEDSDAELSLYLSRLQSMLDAGADPHLEVPGYGNSPIKVAKDLSLSRPSWTNVDKWTSVWTEVVQRMESWETNTL